MQTEDATKQRTWMVTGLFVAGVGARAALLCPSAIVKGTTPSPPQNLRLRGDRGTGILACQFL